MIRIYIPTNNPYRYQKIVDVKKNSFFLFCFDVKALFLFRLPVYIVSVMFILVVNKIINFKKCVIFRTKKFDPPDWFVSPVFMSLV